MFIGGHALHLAGDEVHVVYADADLHHERARGYQCEPFTRMQLHLLAYNLGNFMRTLALSKAAEPWSLTSLRDKLIKIGAKVISHSRYFTFQMAEAAVSRQMFQEILMPIARPRVPPAPA